MSDTYQVQLQAKKGVRFPDCTPGVHVLEDGTHTLRFNVERKEHYHVGFDSGLTTYPVKGVMAKTYKKVHNPAKKMLAVLTHVGYGLHYLEARPTPLMSISLMHCDLVTMDVKDPARCKSLLKKCYNENKKKFRWALKQGKDPPIVRVFGKKNNEYVEIPLVLTSESGDLRFRQFDDFAKEVCSGMFDTDVMHLPGIGATFAKAGIYWSTGTEYLSFPASDIPLQTYQGTPLENYNSRSIFRPDPLYVQQHIEFSAAVQRINAIDLCISNSCCWRVYKGECQHSPGETCCKTNEFTACLGSPHWITDYSSEWRKFADVRLSSHPLMNEVYQTMEQIKGTTSESEQLSIEKLNEIVGKSNLKAVFDFATKVPTTETVEKELVRQTGSFVVRELFEKWIDIRIRAEQDPERLEVLKEWKDCVDEGISGSEFMHFYIMRELKLGKLRELRPLYEKVETKYCNAHGIKPDFDRGLFSAACEPPSKPEPLTLAERQKIAASYAPTHLFRQNKPKKKNRKKRRKR